MNIRHIVLILLLFGVCFAGVSVTDYSISKESFRPGEPGVLTATVSNPSGSERVTGLTLSIENPYEISLTSSPRLADIDAGGSTVVSVPFRVKEDAKTGVYLVSLVFRGYVEESAGASKTTVNTISVPITVVNEPSFSLTVDKQLLSGINTVEFTIANNGGTAKDAHLSIDGDIALYGTDKVYLGTIQEEKKVEVMLDSRDVEDGAVNMMVVLDYEDDYGYSHTLETELRMSVRNEQLDLIFLQKSDLITRGDNDLILEIRNDGDKSLSDVRLSFDDGIKIKQGDEYKFGNLNPGESATVSLPVYTELAPGLNLVDANIDWIENDLQKTESRSIPITITSDADVGVFLEAKPLPLTIGSEHSISVLVSNLGSYNIENVDVSIRSPAFRSLDISDKQYIGGLQRDDFSTVQFLTIINASAEDSYPVHITINYRDQSGEWKQKEIEQFITVYNGVATDESPLPLFFVLVLMAIGVWYFKFRKG